MTDFLLRNDLPQVLLTFDEILKKGFDGHLFIVGLAEHWRNLLVCKDVATTQLLQTAEEVKKMYVNQAASMSASWLISAMNILQQADIQYKNSKNPKLLVEISLMKIAHLQSAIELAKISNTTPSEDSKKKSLDVNFSPKVSVFKPTITIPTDTKTLEAQIEAQKVSEQKNEEIVVIDIKSKYPVQPIDEAKLQEAWLKLLAYWRKHHYDSTEIVVLDRKFQWQNPVLTLTLENTLQREVVEKRKSTWIRFLQEQMQNAHTIEISAEIEANYTQKVPYTNSEKWEYLSKKYPVMDLLKTKLGLDIV
jgi:DNA polymerase-3 subunit gamma/tau